MCAHTTSVYVYTRIQVEYEVLEAILTIEEAIKAASYIGEDAVISRGDPAAVFATGKNVISGEVCAYWRAYMCVCVCPHTTICVSRTECLERRGSYRRSAALLPYMCPHTDIHVSSCCYICASYICICTYHTNIYTHTYVHINRCV